MGFEKAVTIGAIVLLALAAGYLKGKQKVAVLVALGVVLAFYCAEYLFK